MNIHECYVFGLVGASYTDWPCPCNMQWYGTTLGVLVALTCLSFTTFDFSSILRAQYLISVVVGRMVRTRALVHAICQKTKRL